MLASSIPIKMPLAFAATGAKNVIPATSQIAITPGAASLPDGFPPLTLIPKTAGGIPPFGQDMNGILNLISGAVVWLWSGGPVSYDSAFSTAIGGYPQGAMLNSATPGSLWISTVDNNTSNPDTGGANWLAFTPGFSRRFILTSGSSWTPPAGVNLIYVEECVGGGGGGGGTAGAGTLGSGGGGGGYASGIYSVTPLAAIATAFGLGGAGGTNAGTNGAAGGTTSLGSLISATGGGAGIGSTSGVASTSGAAGAGTGGSDNQSGFVGGTGVIAGAAYFAGLGGGTYLASAGQITGNSSSAMVGGSGTYPGVGGGGGIAGGGGGNGAPGRIVIWC